MRIFVFAAAGALLLSSPAWAQRGNPFDQMMALDANGDGAITRAEAEAGRAALFARLDADHDGALSQTERSGGGRAMQALSSADRNNDGHISRVETMSAPYRGFDRMDANSDNVVSAQEIERVRTRLGGG